MKLLLFLSLILSFLTQGCTSYSKNEDLAQRHLDLGNSFFAAGKYPQALKELLKAKKLSSSNPLILNSLAVTYQARGRSDLSIQTFNELLQIHPNFTEGRNNLTRVLIETKRFNEAQVEINKVKKDLTYGALDKVYLNEGLLYFDQQKYLQALEPFSKSIQYGRSNCSAQHFYGRSLFELKRYIDAAQALDRAIAFCQTSGNDEPHYFSALAYYRSGDKRKAAVRFDEIIKLYPKGQYSEKSRALLEVVRKEL